MNKIYYLGDVVYHYKFGQGKVEEIRNYNLYPVRVRFDHGVLSFTIDGRYLMSSIRPTLSFTPYDFESDTFSQVRPIGIKVEDLKSLTANLLAGVNKDTIPKTNKSIYQVGDVVYHGLYGKGVVQKIIDCGQYSISVQFKYNNDQLNHRTFTADGRYMNHQPPSLSFTPYDFVSGGFSQNRADIKKPLPHIKPGQLIYLRDCFGLWRMRYFSHWEDYKPSCFIDQKKEGESTPWDEYSLTNPLEP